MATYKTSQNVNILKINKTKVNISFLKNEQRMYK